MKKFLSFFMLLMVVGVANAQNQKQDQIIYDSLYQITITVMDTVDDSNLPKYLVVDEDGTVDTLNPKYSSQYFYTILAIAKYNIKTDGIEYFHFNGEKVEIPEGHAIYYSVQEENNDSK